MINPISIERFGAISADRRWYVIKSKVMEVEFSFGMQTLPKESNQTTYGQRPLLDAINV